MSRKPDKCNNDTFELNDCLSFLFVQSREQLTNTQEYKEIDSIKQLKKSLFGQPYSILVIFGEQLVLVRDQTSETTAHQVSLLRPMETENLLQGSNLTFARKTSESWMQARAKSYSHATFTLTTPTVCVTVAVLGTN